MNTKVTGTLNSTPNTTFTLEFYSNAECDPFGYGEGETFQAVTSIAAVSTDANGDAAFAFQFVDKIPAGQFLTATATDSNGNTSEFSACVAIGGPAAPLTVTTTADSGPGSLRQAILDAKATPCHALIEFNISGTGPFTIAPESPLPEITDPVAIDGLNQPGANCDSWPPTLMIEISGENAGDAANGLYITAGDSAVRGLVINRFSHDGIWLQSGGGNVIQCNFIGTDVTGASALGNNDTGIYIRAGSQQNLIGSSIRISDRNLISGNAGAGLAISGMGTDHNTIVGNWIGTDVGGTLPISNGLYGVLISDGAAHNLIGGVYPGYQYSSPSGSVEIHPGANIIAFSTWQGVWIADGGAGNTVRRNVIHSNGYLGLDLGPSGVMPNDPGDTDEGANNLQNYPEISSVLPTSVQGTLNSIPNTTFVLDFYRQEICDSSHYGEGEIPLDTTTTALVTTDVNGNAAFSFEFTTPVSGFVTATATAPDGSTSEFSACR
ncbi:MAG: right-handed parallel beta-helix repeat-containing protein, partial [Chloroflexi bacterium]